MPKSLCARSEQQCGDAGCRSASTGRSANLQEVADLVLLPASGCAGSDIAAGSM